MTSERLRKLRGRAEGHVGIDTVMQLYVEDVLWLTEQLDAERKNNRVLTGMVNEASVLLERPRSELFAQACDARDLALLEVERLTKQLRDGQDTKDGLCLVCFDEIDCPNSYVNTCKCCGQEQE